MEQNKKEILLQQVAKINEVIKALKNNFDCDEELADEYSFLNIVESNLKELAKNQ